MRVELALGERKGANRTPSRQGGSYAGRGTGGSAATQAHATTGTCAQPVESSTWSKTASAQQWRRPGARRPVAETDGIEAAGISYCHTADGQISRTDTHIELSVVRAGPQLVAALSDNNDYA